MLDLMHVRGVTGFSLSVLGGNLKLNARGSLFIVARKCGFCIEGLTIEHEVQSYGASLGVWGLVGHDAKRHFYHNTTWLVCKGCMEYPL